MTDLEKLKKLAKERNRKQHIFELQLRSQFLALRMSAILLKSTPLHVIPKEDMEFIDEQNKD